MAGLEQLNSFIGKFLNLWHSGQDATLLVNTLAGEAVVNLRVGLGQAPLPPHQEPHHVHGTSQQRRRQRRAEARKAEQALPRKVAEQAHTEKDIEEVPVQVAKEREAEQADTEKNVEEAPAQVADSLEAIASAEGADAQGNVDDIELKKVGLEVEVDEHETELHVDNNETGNAAANDTINLATVVENIPDEVCPDPQYDLVVDAKEKNETDAREKSDYRENDITVVHAVAHFENSPYSTLVQDDLQSLRKFILSEKHLEKNVGKVEMEVVSRWEVSVQIWVFKSNLWEGARAYIWKHLGGENLWDRQNGTRIKLHRIHVK